MEKPIYISTYDIEDYLFQALIRLGYVPEESEIEDLAELFFDFLWDKGVIGEDESE